MLSVIAIETNGTIGDILYPLPIAQILYRCYRLEYAAMSSYQWYRQFYSTESLHIAQIEEEGSFEKILRRYILRWSYKKSFKALYSSCSLCSVIGTSNVESILKLVCSSEIYLNHIYLLEFNFSPTDAACTIISLIVSMVFIKSIDGFSLSGILKKKSRRKKWMKLVNGKYVSPGKKTQTLKRLCKN